MSEKYTFSGKPAHLYGSINALTDMRHLPENYAIDPADRGYGKVTASVEKHGRMVYMLIGDNLTLIIVDPQDLKLWPPIMRFLEYAEWTVAKITDGRFVMGPRPSNQEINNNDQE
jgi:hypothetical protein